MKMPPNKTSVKAQLTQHTVKLTKFHEPNENEDANQDALHNSFTLRTSVNRGFVCRTIDAGLDNIGRIFEVMVKRVTTGGNGEDEVDSQNDGVRLDQCKFSAAGTDEAINNRKVRGHQEKGSDETDACRDTAA